MPYLLVQMPVKMPVAASWRVALLPGIEQQNLYDRVVEDRGRSADVGYMLLETRIPTYECPSAPFPRKFGYPLFSSTALKEVVEQRGTPLAMTDYAAPYLLDRRGFTRIRTNGPDNAIRFAATWYESGATPTQFGFGIPPSDPPEPNGERSTEAQPPSLHDVTDGLTQTILVFEDAGMPDTKLRNGTNTPGDWGPWAAGLRGESLAGPNLHIGPEYGGEPPVSIRTYHTAGGHFLMCDGSVQSLGFSTDPEVLSAMFTRDLGDREDIPLEEFLLHFVPNER
jgi:hypothetical protein